MALAEKLRESMKKHSEKHRAKESAKKGKNTEGGEIDRFEIHPAEGGHVLETHYKAKDGKHGEYMGRPEPKKSVHKSMSSAMKEMKGSCPCGNCTADTGVAVGGDEKDEDDTEEY